MAKGGCWKGPPGEEGPAVESSRPGWVAQCCAGERSVEEVSGLVEEDVKVRLPWATPLELHAAPGGKGKKVIKSGEVPRRRQRPQKNGINLGCMKGWAESRLRVVLG